MTQNLYVSVSRYNFNYFWPAIELFYRCFFTCFHSSSHSLSLICVHWLHCVQCFMISSIPHVERFWNVIFCMYSISSHLSVSECFAWLNINYMEVHLWTLNVKVLCRLCVIFRETEDAVFPVLLCGYCSFFTKASLLMFCTWSAFVYCCTMGMGCCWVLQLYWS